MAFEPTEYLNNFAQALIEFEAYFDEKLALHKADRYDTFVDIKKPVGYSEAHHKELEKKYTKAGWYMVVYGISGCIRFYAKC